MVTRREFLPELGISAMLLPTFAGVATAPSAEPPLRFVFHGLCSFNNSTIAQTLSGARAAAKWVGIRIGNFAGILGPLVTGLIIDWTGGFRIAFLVAAVGLVGGLITWAFLIGRVEPIQWTTGHRVRCSDII